jgi:hypothetical protein
MSYGSETICIVGAEFGANSARRGTGKHNFLLYGLDGRLVLHVWTSAPVTYSVECSACQARLDRGELSRVEVSREAMSGPFDRKDEDSAPKFTMYARAGKKARNNAG